MVGTTDASSVFLTTDDGLIGGVPAKVSVVGPTGAIETGKVVQVPLFVNVGDKLKIDTRSGDYITRA